MMFLKIKRFLFISNKEKYRKLKTIYFNLFKLKAYKKNIKKDIDNFDFSIISNNCFAGSVYQDFDLPYLTPTVGLFFYSDCYMKFVSNIDYYIKQDLFFVNDSKYEKNINYPIGKIDDIEIHFLHYSSQKEAKEKWDKRKKRINWENIYFVFSDLDGFDDENYEQFKQLKSYNKVLLTSQEKYKGQDVVILKEFINENHIGEITLNKWTYIKDFSVTNFLNKKKKKKC